MKRADAEPYSETRSGRVWDDPGVSLPLDMAVAAFLALRAEFFDAELAPLPFQLRDKGNTQDDPLDEHIASRLDDGTPHDVVVVAATGPLISPDMVVATPEGVREIRGHEDELGTSEAVGVEVKKLERTKAGGIARPGGIDYNSTPPSKTISVFYERDRIKLPGFYLFVCLEHSGAGRYSVTALALCDGGVLNEDVDLYDTRTGIRKKAIGLGSYGDGLDRERPMLVFANPLGWYELDRTATLIHRRHDLNESGDLNRIGQIERTHPKVPEQPASTYSVYRTPSDASYAGKPFLARDPFPAVKKRTEATQARGRFRLNL